MIDGWMDQWMDGWIDQMIYESMDRWTVQRPGICAVDNFQRLRFDSLSTSSQESV